MLYLMTFIAGAPVWGALGYGVAEAHRWLKRMHHALKSIRSIFTLAKWGLIGLIIVVLIMLRLIGVI